MQKNPPPTPCVLIVRHGLARLLLVSCAFAVNKPPSFSSPSSSWSDHHPPPGATTARMQGPRVRGRIRSLQEQGTKEETKEKGDTIITYQPS